jgi:hypothetical protein
LCILFILSIFMNQAIAQLHHSWLQGLHPVLGNQQKVKAPWIVQQFKRFPVLRRIPARLIGIGVRPEHVKTREMK